QLCPGRKFPVPQQVDDFFVSGVAGEVGDAVAAVIELSGLPIDRADAGVDRDDVFQPGLALYSHLSAPPLRPLYILAALACHREYRHEPQMHPKVRDPRLRPDVTSRRLWLGPPPRSQAPSAPDPNPGPQQRARALHSASGSPESCSGGFLRRAGDPTRSGAALPQLRSCLSSQSIGSLAHPNRNKDGYSPSPSSPRFRVTAFPALRPEPARPAWGIPSPNTSNSRTTGSARSRSHARVARRSRGRCR